MAHYRGNGRTSNPQRKPCHKPQIQPDIHNRRYRKKDQRHCGISHRPQQAGKEIIQGGGQQSTEDYHQIFSHQALQLLRHLQECKDRPKSPIDHTAYRQRCQQDQHKAVKYPLPQLPGLSGALTDGIQRPCAPC